MTFDSRIYNIEGTWTASPLKIQTLKNHTRD